jgi:anti-sigma-K factor RskA
MNPQHLSDEAVAAFADGVLTGSARERATRHIDSCRECRQAVTVQREAAFALRAASAPALPNALLDRLRTVPQTTPLPSLPTALAPDGTTMLATSFAPMAAFVPDSTPRSPNRVRPIVTTAAIVAIAGALAAGSVAREQEPSRIGTGHTVQHTTTDPGGADLQVVNPVSFLRGSRP